MNTLKYLLYLNFQQKQYTFTTFNGAKEYLRNKV